MGKNTHISKTKLGLFYAKKKRFVKNHYSWLVPVLLLLSLVVTYLFLGVSKFALSGIHSMFDWSVLNNGSVLFYSLGLVTVFAGVVYYVIDYQQHYKPLAQELEDVQYSHLHHAKVVVLPRIKYRWKLLAFWFIIGTTGLLAMALVISLQVNRVFAYAPDEFVSTWDTTKYVAGDVTASEIKIYTNPLYSYNYDVNWGDGNTDTGITADHVHTYASTGVYEVKITGTFPAIYWGDTAASDQIMSVEQWGTNPWSTMASAFIDADNVVFNAVDAPDLSGVSSMASMFYLADNFNSNINSWDVSNITDTSEMFNAALAYNQPLNNWNVGLVTNMSSMFYSATSFNSSLAGWNAISATDMSSMFSGATSFDQPINDWQTNNVENMAWMFDGASSFNQPLNSWETGSVTYADSMFKDATSFNQSLDQWDISSLPSLQNMFNGASSFDQSLADWDMSGVTSAHSTLTGTTISVANYDATIIGWASQTLQPNVPFISDAMFCSSDTERTYIIDTFNWTITDGGSSCLPPDVALGTISGLSETTADVEGQITVVGSYPIDAVGFDYGPTTSYGASTSQAFSGSSPDSFYETISGLECGNTYHYRAYATYTDPSDSSQYSVYSADDTFSTTSCPQPTEDQTDYSMSISLLNNGAVNSGDQVNYRFTLKNEGPSDAGFYGYVYILTPPEVSVSSITAPDTLVQQGPSLFDSLGGVPQDIADKYSGYYFTVLSLPGIPVADTVGSTYNINVAGTANADFVDGSTTVRGLYINPAYEPIFVQIFQNAIATGQDFFELPQNNVAKTIYSSSTTPTTETTTPTTPTTTTEQEQTADSNDFVGSEPSKVVTNNSTPSFNELVTENPDLNPPDEGKTKPSSGESKHYFLSGNIARVGQNLPWIMLQVMATVFFAQAFIRYLQNRKLKKALAMSKKTHDGLLGFLAIVSHYLRTASTIIGSSVELLESKLVQPVSQNINDLKAESQTISIGINSIIEKLKQNIETIDKPNQQIIQNKPRWFFPTWIIVPTILSVALLLFNYLGLNRLGFWQTGQGAFLFSAIALAASIVILLLSFVLLEGQRHSNEKLNVSIAASKESLQSRINFIDENKLIISNYVSRLENKSANIDEPDFNRLFGSGLQKLQHIGVAFSKVFELSSAKRNASFVLGKNQLIHSIARFDDAVKKRQIRLEVNVPDDIAINLSQHELDHLVAATLSNSIKFSDHGGLVQLSANNDNHEFNLTVRDHGQGIEKDKIDMLMQPFSRATAINTYDHEGLGLNLYITKLIANKYNGKVSVQSAPAKGTSLKFSSALLSD